MFPHFLVYCWEFELTNLTHTYQGYQYFTGAEANATCVCANATTWNGTNIAYQSYVAVVVSLFPTIHTNIV